MSNKENFENFQNQELLSRYRITRRADSNLANGITQRHCPLRKNLRGIDKRSGNVRGNFGEGTNRQISFRT